MITKILKSKPLVEELYIKLEVRINKLIEVNVVPKLAAILVGDDPASNIYVNSKAKVFKKLGCESETFKLSAESNENEILELIKKLNNDPEIHGILVQLPLPIGINSRRVLHSVSKYKDVDGFHPYNLGCLLEGYPSLIPCTPNGVIELLKFYKIPVSGRHAVIVGRSNIVGKPLFALLAQKLEIGNATVTLCHTGTKDLAYYTRQADILIAAVGVPKVINKAMIKNGVDIIDVGINRISNNSSKGYELVGDVDYDSVLGFAKSITPVPGGVGPMTITMLAYNTVCVAEKEYHKMELSI